MLLKRNSTRPGTQKQRRKSPGTIGKAAPSDRIELWPIDKPIDAESNARTHSKKQIEELRHSFRKYGQVWPILCREGGEIIAGHGRRLAAKLEGQKSIKVLVAKGWTEQQCRAFALLDNRIPLNAGWDADKLASELKVLRDDGEELLELGFSEGDIKRLLPNGEREEQTFEPSYQVLIECKDEKDQLRLLKKLEKDGISCRALIA